MWGSITPNTASQCNWSNAPFNNGSSSCDYDYFHSVKDTVCPNGILAKEYDAASQIMGGNWRMPTQSECEELYKNTTTEWVTDYNGTGVNGTKFTSKTDTSKYIFIPAAGECYNGSVDYVGRCGYIWSSSLDNGSPYGAWNLSLWSNYVSVRSANERIRGYTVRGICE